MGKFMGGHPNAWSKAPRRLVEQLVVCATAQAPCPSSACRPSSMRLPDGLSFIDSNLSSTEIRRRAAASYTEGKRAGAGQLQLLDGVNTTACTRVVIVPLGASLTAWRSVCPCSWCPWRCSRSSTGGSSSTARAMGSATRLQSPRCSRLCELHVCVWLFTYLLDFPNSPMRLRPRPTCAT